MTKKIIASFIGLSMVLMAVPVQGATVEELQAQITDLMAQITALNTQIAALTGTPATGVPAACVGITFTSNLSQGSTGANVQCLQALLNTDAATQVAVTGAGSPGAETTYFGPLTRAAVVKFQEKYAAEVLTPIGLTAGTGFVGPQTRAKLNAMLTTPVTPPPDDDDDVTDPDDPIVDPTEGILTVEVNPVPASGVQVYEGDTNVAVLGILAKAKLSDITLQRITFNFGAFRIYDYLSYLSLYDGENAVTGIDLSSATVYKTGGVYYLQLSGLNIKVPKDGSKVLTVKVNAVPSLASWVTAGNVTIGVAVDGVRGVDTAGILQYGPSAPITRTFSVNATLAASAALTFSRASDSPLPRNIGTGSLGIASGVELLRLNVKAEYDAVKITDINNVAVVIGGTGGATSGTAYLYNADTVVGSSAVTAGVANFTDIEVIVAKDATKTLIVKADFSSASTTLSTSTAAVTVNTTNIIAENSLGMTVTSLSGGTVTGYPVYVYTIAPTLALTSATITKTAASAVASSTADATIKFTVTAEGGDVTVTSTGAITAVYTTTTASGGTGTGVALTYTVAGAGTPSGGVYTIAKDTTATITVDVNVNAATLPAGYQGNYGYVTLTGVTWNATQLTNWLADIYKTTNVLLP